MPLVADLTGALVAGLTAFLGARWYARSGATPERPSVEVARVLGETVKPHPGPRRLGLLARRLDREVASGLLLTIAISVTVLGGLVLGVLAVVVRRVPLIQHVDNWVAAWGFDHRSGQSTTGLHAITDLGSIQIVVALAILLALLDFVRTRNRWTLLFLTVVLVGMELAQHGVKDLVGRLRPTLVPAAAQLGPSFPSGHSAAAAAFYAAAALVVGRWLHRQSARHVVSAVAVGIAVAVAASRVLLDLHWLSDVVGGLTLGWAWFALTAVVFGGRLLIPTAAADVVAVEAAPNAARCGYGRSRLRRGAEDAAASGSAQTTVFAAEAESRGGIRDERRGFAGCNRRDVGDHPRVEVRARGRRSGAPCCVRQPCRGDHLVVRGLSVDLPSD
jgi:membrane-associated phospholipid phosphatase